VINRSRDRGRPSNEDLRARGVFKISDKCKICLSPYREEITKLLLTGTSGEDIRRQFNQLEYFKTAPLNPTNITSHKRHCDPEALAEYDHEKEVKKELDATIAPELQKLYQVKYDETLNKLTAIDQMYKQRLLNLSNFQREFDILSLKSVELQTPQDKARLKELHFALEISQNSITQAMLKHLKLEQGPAQKNVNLIFISNMKTGIEQFIEAFMDIIVNEIPDGTLRERLKDKFTEKLNSIIAPLLDEKKAVNAEYEIIETKQITEEIKNGKDNE
jgi:hypothetical protein